MPLGSLSRVKCAKATQLSLANLKRNHILLFSDFGNSINTHFVKLPYYTCCASMYMYEQK